MILAAVLFAFMVTAAFAGGDKNCHRHRGEIGQGSVEQHQVRVNR